MHPDQANSAAPISPQFVFTVVITCFNEGDDLARATQSLLEQDDQDFDILIVNDGSTDSRTNQICDELEKTNVATVIRHPKNKGCSAARNSGYQHMRGNVCVNLDADDTLPPNAIRDIRRAWNEVPDADFIFGDYIKNEISIGQVDRVYCNVLCDKENLLDASTLIPHWTLHGSSPCKKAAWQRVGGEDYNFSWGGRDVDFQMKLLASGARGYYANALIYNWNRAPTGLNSNWPENRHCQLFIKNIVFFDQFATAEQFKKLSLRHLRFSLLKNHYQDAKNLASLLIKRQSCSPLVLMTLLLPISLTCRCSRMFALLKRFLVSKPLMLLKRKEDAT